MAHYYAYVVCFDETVSRRHFLDSLNKVDEIVNWATWLPCNVFVISELSAEDLTDRIQDATGVKRLLVLDAHTERNGWLPRAAWDFLKNRRPAVVLTVKGK